MKPILNEETFNHDFVELKELKKDPCFPSLLEYRSKLFQDNIDVPSIKFDWSKFQIFLYTFPAFDNYTVTIFGNVFVTGSFDYEQEILKRYESDSEFKNVVTTPPHDGSYKVTDYSIVQNKKISTKEERHIEELQAKNKLLNEQMREKFSKLDELEKEKNDIRNKLWDMEDSLTIITSKEFEQRVTESDLKVVDAENDERLNKLRSEFWSKSNKEELPWNDELGYTLYHFSCNGWNKEVLQYNWMNRPEVLEVLEDIHATDDECMSKNRSLRTFLKEVVVKKTTIGR